MSNSCEEVNRDVGQASARACPGEQLSKSLWAFAQSIVTAPLFKLVCAALKDIFLFVLEGGSGEAEGVCSTCHELLLLQLSDGSYLVQVL